MTHHNEKRKYLFVLPWKITHAGGVNQVVVNLYGEFQSDGKYDPILLVTDWSQSKLRLVNEAGLNNGYYRLRSPFDPQRPIVGLLAFFLTAPIRLFTLYRFLKKYQTEVVNPHYPTLGALNFALLKCLGLFGGKLVLSFHGADIANASKGKGLERMFWKLLLRSADSIVTCSKSLAQVVSAFSPESTEKIEVVHNGINVRKIAAAVDRTAAVDQMLYDQPFILNIATFESKKGQDILLRAFQKVGEKYPDLRLVLIGRSGDAESHLKCLAEQLGISGRLLIIKDLQHERVTAFLEKASIFVLPSRVEPFGIVILEAGLFNIPVIASAVGGVPEILENGVTGYLIAPEDPSELAEKIIALLQDPVERIRLASNLHNHVLEHFDWKNAYKRYVKIANK